MLKALFLRTRKIIVTSFNTYYVKYNREIPKFGFYSILHKATENKYPRGNLPNKQQKPERKRYFHNDR